MTNPVHLVAIPKRATSMAKAIGQAHWNYVMCFNKNNGRQGHLWQNRFYSCPLGASRLVAALAYVDLNTVRAAMVGSATRYQRSSTASHCGSAANDRLIDEGAWVREGLTRDWEERLRAESTGTRAAELRRARYSGLPFGN